MRERSLIADACIAELGDALLKGHVNLNTANLEDLKGNVICAFSSKGVTELRWSGGSERSTASSDSRTCTGGAHADDFAGLQYDGKGATAVWKPFSRLSQNEERQRKLIADAGRSDPDVIGMMYGRRPASSRASGNETRRCGMRLTWRSSRSCGRRDSRSSSGSATR